MRKISIFPAENHVCMVSRGEFVWEHVSEVLQKHTAFKNPKLNQNNFLQYFFFDNFILIISTPAAHSHFPYPILLKMMSSYFDILLFFPSHYPTESS